MALLTVVSAVLIVLVISGARTKAPPSPAEMAENAPSRASNDWYDWTAFFQIVAAFAGAGGAVFLITYGLLNERWDDSFGLALVVGALAVVVLATMRYDSRWERSDEPD
jgi:hypothetical protein